MDLDAWLPRAAAHGPDRVAVEADDATLTYAELLARACGAAGALAERGAAPGTRVGIVLPPSAAFAEALHACWLAGAVAVPVDPRLSRDEREARLAGCAVVVDAPVAGERASGIALDRRCHSGAAAVVVHTSGTSGAPRPVTLTFGNLLWSALGSALAIGLDRDERWLGPLPVAHVGGLSVLTRSAIYGTTAILHERWDTERVRELLAGGGASVVSLVPTMLARLLDAGLHEPRSLRVALLGGAGAAPGLLARAREAGVPVMQTYGMTEAASQVATDGRPLLGVDVRLADDGEILVSGPTVGPGAAAEDGWLHTGDLGAWTPDGRLRVTGRRDDLVISGGENIAPGEVEAVLEAHPAVAEAAAFGVPDEEWGQRLEAVVVLRPGAGTSEAELREHCAARLARFKVPKRIGFAPELPRTPSGKLMRRRLVPIGSE